ncbi:hypothetical protein QBC33DRAFT_457494 [Phialemonium atrogriseum]|uniref:Uncharacterized protein n=1 Tax=Phialemonium atrogriseum TaxID=1093897 RepID=A0AAJ0FD95_9PEZI|nr:uncharacterized protein QBC33DRAFT_457494 [Phialemonium atrogriseum]KAK1764366.1 hypothetical protein QBC33DRAFT_457494 [Phialemonium atrogriseum]
METSAAKRRKLSPQASVPIDNHESTTPQDAPPERLTRASYASPTKSSLSRHNPDVLKKRQAPAARLKAPPPGPAESAINEPPRSPVRKIGGAMASRPRRSPIKPTPRPLPPPGPDDDEEILNPFLGRVLRRSPAAAEPEVVPEPELPPTPQHPDPVVSTPPTGIHSTPSRRPRRSKALAEKIRSSPTKQQLPAKEPPTKDAPTREAPTKQLPPNSREFQNGAHSNTIAAPPPAIHEEQRGRDGQSPHVSTIRGVEPLDPDAEKRRQRDALLAEIKQLESDLDVMARENERIRLSHPAKIEAPAPKNGNELVGILRRHVTTSEKTSQPQLSPSWVQTALNPIAFLPFSKPSSSLPTLFPEDSTSAEPDSEIISHHPIPMSAEEALPYLQVFTPLSFTSHISILPTDDADDPSLQRHSITATSASAPGLLSARIEMTVDTRSHAVVDLAVPRLDPPAAAAELASVVERVGAVARQRSDSDDVAGASAAAGNVAVLAWAIAEWLRLAVRRAKAWRALERELGTEEGVVESVGRMRARRRGRKGGGAAGPGGEDGDAEVGDGYVDDGSVADVMGSLVDASDLLPYMGQRSMDFRVPALGGGGGGAETADLRVQWRIEFDWTGEGRSRIGVLVGMPGKWHHADGRDRLSGIPALFDELLQQNDDPVASVRTIVALLAGGQGS